MPFATRVVRGEAGKSSLRGNNQEQGKKRHTEEQEGQDRRGERIIFGPLLAVIRWA